MPIVAGLLSILGRFAGRLLNTTLGWAALLLFGKVPQKKQFVLLLMVFGSLVWVALIVGVLVPDVGTLLVAAVPAPDFVDETWIRLAMLAGTLIVPLVIGIAAIYVTPPASRPRGAKMIVSVLRGYPFAFALAVIMVVLAVVASVRKIRSMSKRWEDAHVPVIVKPGKYDAVLEMLRDKLERSEIPTTPHDAGMLVSGPPKLLDLIAGRSLGDLVPDRLMLLVGQGLEVLVYPSDLAISGTRVMVARARAAIVSELAEAPAYMTTSAEAQLFEDELERLGAGAGQAHPAEVIRHLRSLDKRLATLTVPIDEWETLYRMRLQLERDALSALESVGSDDFADFDEDIEPTPRSASRLDFAIGLAGTALIALDLAMLLSDRRRRDAKAGHKRP